MWCCFNLQADMWKTNPLATPKCKPVWFDSSTTSGKAGRVDKLAVVCNASTVVRFIGLTTWHQPVGSRGCCCDENFFGYSVELQISPASPSLLQHIAASVGIGMMGLSLLGSTFISRLHSHCSHNFYVYTWVQGMQLLYMVVIIMMVMVMVMRVVVVNGRVCCGDGCYGDGCRSGHLLTIC